MYKVIQLPHGGYNLQEHFGRPIVYADHWALNDLSADDKAKARFTSMMKMRQGTLRISVYNILETAKQKDREQVKTLTDMLRTVDCGFININPTEVIEREDVLIGNPAIRYNPSQETDLVEAHLVAHNFPEEWHPVDIILTVLSQPETVRRIMQNNDSFARNMKNLIEQARSSEASIRNASGRFKRVKTKGQIYQTATRELLQMAVAFVVRNTSMNMSASSEWNDLFHVIVPVAYCDIVLLDKRWRTFVQQTGLRYPGIARVFDKKSLKEFFEFAETAKFSP